MSKWGKTGIVIRGSSLWFIGDFLAWPFWWYSHGVRTVGQMWIRLIRGEEERLRLGVWVRHLFTPMFGQYDVEGRIISFFARLVVILYRGSILLLYMIATSLFLIAWLILPPIIGYQLISHLQVLLAP